MTTTKLKTANALTFVFAIVMNTLANAMPLGGMNTGELSALYPNLFVPAGFTFSIWGVIYLALTAHLIWQWVGDSDKVVRAIGPWLAINFIANGTWIAVWHAQMVYASIAVMLVLLFSLIKLYRLLAVDYKLNGLQYKVPISIYLGWISVATIANVTTVLVHSGVTELGLGAELWTVLMVTTAALLAVGFLWTRRDVFYAAVIIWAAYGIYSRRVADTASMDGSIETTAMAVMVIIGILTALQLGTLLLRNSSQPH